LITLQPFSSAKAAAWRLQQQLSISNGDGQVHVAVVQGVPGSEALQVVGVQAARARAVFGAQIEQKEFGALLSWMRASPVALCALQ
jgi:hypothetical protein